MRTRPEYANELIWGCFEFWADMNNVGDEHEGDWLPWWNCYEAGSRVGYNDEESF